MGLEARRRAIERFPELRCTERTEEVYRHWLEVRHRRRSRAELASMLPAAVGNGANALAPNSC